MSLHLHSSVISFKPIGFVLKKINGSTLNLNPSFCIVLKYILPPSVDLNIMRPIVNIKSNTFNITEEVLGAGSFSLVKKAYLKGSENAIALKIYHCNSEAEWLQSINEICLLRKLVHKNIAALIHYEITRFHVLIGLDKGEATLVQFIKKQSSEVRKNYAISIMSQIINALNLIHSFNIIHGDIKPNNIIYTFQQHDLKIQILDFGLSHVATRPGSPPPKSDPGGTKNYLAPERLSQSSYEETSDLFSAGIVFFEILFQKHPFYKDKEDYCAYMKSKPDPEFPEGYQSKVPKEWLLLLCSMLSYNPNNRNEVRNNQLLQTTFPTRPPVNHEAQSRESILNAEVAEKNGNYSEAAVLFMNVCIDLGIANHKSEREQKDITTLENTILAYKRKVLSLIHLFRHSFFPNESLAGTCVHDEFYEYLMQVTASTPNLKHHIEIGYNGEMYFKECNRDRAFRNLMDALHYLNNAMLAEPPGDRKTIIGKKMLQWTHIAESLKK